MKNDWIEADNTLQKTFYFADFKTALAFVNSVGEIAESVQHHRRWMEDVRICFEGSSMQGHIDLDSETLCISILYSDRYAKL